GYALNDQTLLLLEKLVISLPFVSITALAAGMCMRAMRYSLMREKEAARIAEELRFSHDHLSPIVNALDGVLWQRNASSWNFVSLSRQAEGFLGYSKAQWQSGAEFFQKLVHPEDLPQLRLAWSQLTPVLKRYQVEFRMMAADGSWRWLCENGSSLQDSQGEMTLCGILKDVTSRQEELAARKMLHEQQLEAAHEAGKAEIAKNVLHNIGNVMNSLNVSAKLHMEALSASRASNLGRAAKLLKENQENLAHFIQSSRQGRRLPDYLISVSEHLMEENRRLHGEALAMVHHIEHMRDIIALEQVNGRASSFQEQCDLAGLLEQALTLEGNILMDEGITIERNYADLPPQMISRGQFLQVMVNLISNARHAVSATSVKGPRRISLGISAPRSGRILITVTDTGCGISETNLARIFTHGFTTRKDGNGFGLHHAALLADEMGGSLRAESAGEGCGATFTLELPVRTVQTTPSDPTKSAVPLPSSLLMLTQQAQSTHTSAR
ncbi:MAG: PAS domain-containing protein, partial [Prosthecobacter sp.]|nr:PAS domain-containing protein [Prosthecobacter sp.]